MKHFLFDTSILYPAIIAILLFPPGPKMEATTAVGNAETITDTANGLKVEVSTDKEEYELGEPIIVTVVLRNVGEKIFWFNKSSMDLTPGDEGNVQIELYGANGKFLGPTPFIIDRPPWPIGPGRFEAFLSTRFFFRPGGFVGVTIPLEELGITVPEPGRYRVRAWYGDVDYTSANRWKWRREHPDAEEIEQLTAVPIWEGEIFSDNAWFEVQPENR